MATSEVVTESVTTRLHDLDPNSEVMIRVAQTHAAVSPVYGSIMARLYDGDPNSRDSYDSNSDGSTV